MANTEYAGGTQTATGVASIDEAPTTPTVSLFSTGLVSWVIILMTLLKLKTIVTHQTLMILVGRYLSLPVIPKG